VDKFANELWEEERYYAKVMAASFLWRKARIMCLLSTLAKTVALKTSLDIPIDNDMAHENEQEYEREQAQMGNNNPLLLFCLSHHHHSHA
jgi:hypothetical protein